MKFRNYLLGLALLAIVGGSAHAATELRLVGSTAFRASATAAIISYISTTKSDHIVNGAYIGTGTSTNTGLFTANEAIFENSDASVIVKTYWTGSLAGVVDLVTNQASNYKFLGDSTSVSAINLSTPTYGATVTSASATDSTAPNAAFSDSFYTSIASSLEGAGNFSGTVGTAPTTATSGATLANLINNAPLQDGGVTAGSYSTVGIVPFAWWVDATGASTGITNITQQAAEALIAGPIPVSFLTGNASDLHNYLYLVGRNEDSGTRIGAFAEAQTAGFFGAPAAQWQLTFSNNETTDPAAGTSASPGYYTGGPGSTITGLGPWPATSPLNTEPDIDWNIAGHSGYISGVDVADALLATNPQAVSSLSFGLTSRGKTTKPSENTGKAFFIGYLGFADGNNVDSLSTNAGPGQYLNYNGVAPTVVNIQNGAYTFWSYEHLYYLTSGANAVTSGTTQTVADGIADLIFSTYAPTNSNGVTATSDAAENTLSPPVSGILLDGAFSVTRPQEGAFLEPNY